MDLIVSVPEFTYLLRYRLAHLEGHLEYKQGSLTQDQRRSHSFLLAITSELDLEFLLVYHIQ